MDNEQDYGEEDVREHPEQTGGHWDAVGSLKRNAKRPSDEVTPLLDNGRGSSADRGNGPQEPPWEGAADFEGLTWLHKPSVSWAHLVD